MRIKIRYKRDSLYLRRNSNETEYFFWPQNALGLSGFDVMGLLCTLEK